MLIYKTLLGLTPPYLRYLLQRSSSTYNTRSASHILLKVPKVNTSLGRSSFQFSTASDWNELQQYTQTEQFNLNLFIQRLNHGHSYWHLWLLRVMYCCLYLLALCAVVCAQSCLYHVLCCYHVVVMLCCYHAVLSCVAALLCCCLRSLFVLCCLSCCDVCFVLYLYVFLFYF